MIQQASIHETLRYRRPNLGDAHRARARLEREQRLVEGLRCGLGIGLGQGGPMQGLRLGSGVINFGSLFPPGSVLQSIQTDIGLTVGGTMLDTGGTGPVVSISGSFSGPPVPIWIKATSGGARGVWTYAVYYDGTGTTPAMTGLSTGIVPLTGAGTGLFVSIATGTATNGNIWKATCSALADQSGLAINATQGTANAQPVLTIGLNGVAGLGFNGVNQFFSFTLALPDPATTPTFFWGVWRQLGTAASNSCVTGDTSGTGLLLLIPLTTSVVEQYSGAVANASASISLGTWLRAEALFSNSGNDYLKCGATRVQTGNAGNTVGSPNRRIADANGGNRANIELLALVTTNALPSPAQLTALSAAVTTKYGASVQV